MPVLRHFVALALLVSAPALAADPRDSFQRDSRGTARMVWEPAFLRGSGEADESFARRFLAANRERFALPEDERDLPLLRRRESLTAVHFRFGQLRHGIPVENAEIVVSVSRGDGRIVRVANDVRPARTLGARIVPSIGAEDALDLAWADLRVHGGLLASVPEATLLWERAEGGLRLVWKTFVPVEAPFGHWEHRIDAESGEILSVRRTELIRKGEPEKVDFAAWTGAVRDRAAETEAIRRRAGSESRGAAAPSAVANGTCQTFDPDPCTTLMDDTLEDNSTILPAAYVNRPLREITLTGSTYSLVGPWVTIANTENPNTAPSTTTTGNWNYTRGPNAFDDALVYFHLDQNQRYMQSLGFTGATGIQQLSISADTDGLNGADNSWYIPSSNRLAFGHGCVDDDEDADVVLHEYGHAIQHDILGGAWSGGDTGAMGEGFGDYWGGSYSYGTPNGPFFHPEWIYTWDGHNLCWSGRVMNQTSYCYDPGSSYGAHQTVGGIDGDELWSTPLFQALVNGIAQGIPHSEMDQIVLEAHFGLVSGASMPELADATVAAAEALHPGGLHAGVFRTAFADVCILSLTPMAQPNLTYPAGGESIVGGTSTNVTWTRNGAPSNALYQVQYTPLCTPALVLSDDVEGTAKFTNTKIVGQRDWVVATTRSNSPTRSWWMDDHNKVTQARLTQNTAAVLPAGAALSFWHNYETESGFDGGVVEISTNGGSTWADLGALLTQNGYGSALGAGSALAGRAAFHGNSGGWIETRANLASYAGQSVRIRFEFATNGSTGGLGWWIDDVSLGQLGTWTTIGTSGAGASSLGWTLPTTPGTDYCVRLLGTASGYLPSPTESGSPFTITAPAAAPTPVPDGSAARPGAAMTGRKNGASNVDVTWDATCAGPTGYNLYSGAIGSFTAVTGGSCAIGNGTTTRAINGDSWWILTSTGSSTTIGSQGLMRPSAERALTAWTGVCTQNTKNTSGSCP